MKRMNNLYRILLCILMLISVVSFFFPWGMFYSDREIRAVVIVNSSGVLPAEHVWLIGALLTSGYVISYAGMIFYKRWARLLLTLIVLMGGLLIPLYGASFQSGIEGLLGYLASIGDGFVLALAYFSGIGAKFQGAPDLA